MLEHAIWFDLVKRCLKKTLLFKFVVLVVINRSKLLGLRVIS